jgi:hypothetical protein
MSIIRLAAWSALVAALVAVTGVVWMHEEMVTPFYGSSSPEVFVQIVSGAEAHASPPYSLIRTPADLRGACAPGAYGFLVFLEGVHTPELVVPVSNELSLFRPTSEKEPPPALRPPL